jgi:hypothetical protein
MKNTNLFVVFIFIIIATLTIPDLNAITDWHFLSTIFYTTLILLFAHYISKKSIDAQVKLIQMIASFWGILHLIFTAIGFTTKMGKSNFWSIYKEVRFDSHYSFEGSFSGFDAIKYSYDFSELLYYGFMPVVIMYLILRIYFNINMLKITSIKSTVIENSIQVESKSTKFDFDEFKTYFLENIKPKNILFNGLLIIAGMLLILSFFTGLFESDDFLMQRNLNSGEGNIIYVELGAELRWLYIKILIGVGIIAFIIYTLINYILKGKSNEK